MDEMKKIIITGPESSGKTALASNLAEYFNTFFVPEYARTYLSNLDRPYVEEDLYHIAKGQYREEKKHAPKAGRLLICDTSMLVMKVWSEYCFQRIHPFILENLEKNPVDLYLLCKPDIPWQPDPLRENPIDRDVLYDMYHQSLIELRAPFVVISGLRAEQRLELAVQAIHSLES